MKLFEIWSEGYSATGEHQQAYKEGEIEAESFDDACIKFLGDRLDKNPDGSYRRGSLRTPFPPGVDRTEAVKHGGNYSIWACQLFDNEADARKSFG